MKNLNAFARPMTWVAVTLMAMPLGASMNESLKQPAPYPKYLKAWNESFTPAQVYHKLKSVTSVEWKNWYVKSHRGLRLHRTSVEFLEREMFFVRTSGSLTMINTSQMNEGILLISRRAFHFDRSEPLEQIAQRLQKEKLNNRYQMSSKFQFFLHLLWGAPEGWADATRPAVRIAPLITLIDIERTRLNCLDHLEGVTPLRLARGNKSGRSIASVPAPEPSQGLSPECQASKPVVAPSPLAVPDRSTDRSVGRQ